MVAKNKDIIVDSAQGMLVLLKKLKVRWSKESLTEELEEIAEILLSRAIESPIPTDTGDLAGSGATERDPRRGEVRFGFNKVYAAFQDADGKSEQVIVPKRKKFLYVPLTQKGKKHRAGLNPKDEGLVRGKDFILTKRVVVKTKPYGSEVGPNMYFSQTMRDNTEFVFEEIARRMTNRARKAAGGGLK